MVRAEKYIFFEASSQISDMDEKYEVLLTGDSSGQVQLNIVKEFGFVPLSLELVQPQLRPVQNIVV